METISIETNIPRELLDMYFNDFPGYKLELIWKNVAQTRHLSTYLKNREWNEQISIKLASSDSNINKKLNCSSWLNFLKSNVKKCPKLLFNQWLNQYNKPYQSIENGINFETTKINNKHLPIIYNNIDQFSKFIQPFSKLLFICSSKNSDNIGGAALNCLNLAKYYQNNNHTVLVLHLFKKLSGNEIKTNDNNDLNVIRTTNLYQSFNQLDFQPDAIILKTQGIDIKKYFKCPTIYLVPGIYNQTINLHYSQLNSIELQKKYIIEGVIWQIKASDYNFANSLHICDILDKYFGLNVGLFYSSFIPYYGQNIPVDPNFDKRPYEYGLIVSDFTRPIKNILTSINFLKNKSNVILIGNNSHLYQDLGFTCLEHIPHSEINQYYQQIKYIRQDSFSEGCSNVIIEALFNGCLIEKPGLE